MRLIDAEELKKTFVGNRYGTKAIEYYIDNAPTVDAEPVRHGRWDGATCSVCGFSWSEVTYEAPQVEMSFCPNCGAKMDEEEKDCERCLQVTERPGNDICKACGGRRGQDATRVEDNDLRDLRE